MFSGHYEGRLGSSATVYQPVHLYDPLWQQHFAYSQPGVPLCLWEPDPLVTLVTDAAGRTEL